MEAGFSSIEKNGFLVTIEALLACIKTWETDAESTFEVDFFFFTTSLLPVLHITWFTHFKCMI